MERQHQKRNKVKSFCRLTTQLQGWQLNWAILVSLKSLFNFPLSGSIFHDWPGFQGTEMMCGYNN